MEKTTKIINFRGKRIDNGEWVYGYLFKIRKPSAGFITFASAIQVMDMDKMTSDSFEVISETVTQYVGLKDKIGRYLYENDIVKWCNKYIGVLEWKNGMAGYYFVNKGVGFQFHDCQEVLQPHGGLKHVEYIGNIWDTPNLLNMIKEKM